MLNIINGLWWIQDSTESLHIPVAANSVAADQHVDRIHDRGVLAGK
jgi:hypothetical protein